MPIFDIPKEDITTLNDSDLRELVGRLCEVEGSKVADVHWGGAQQAPDGGLDVEVNWPNSSQVGDFIPRSHTGFQVKMHSIGEKNCTKEMLKDGKPRPIIEQLANESGAYIIVSGKDDCSGSMLSSRLKGMDTALTSLSNRKQLKPTSIVVTVSRNGLESTRQFNYGAARSLANS